MCVCMLGCMCICNLCLVGIVLMGRSNRHFIHTDLERGPKFLSLNIYDSTYLIKKILYVATIQGVYCSTTKIK